jgi:GT2 family glycosyltransferase
MIPVLIVPTLIHYDLLQNMLNSIDIEVEEIIIIDNGGKLKNIECSFAKKISIINMPRNLGVAASWNLGIKLTPYSKWWLICNDDIIFKPNMLQRIIDSNFDSIIFDKNKSRYFSAFAIHEELVEKVGLFNEYFYPGIGEEVDYIERLHKNNITIFNLKNFFDHHEEGGNTLKYFGFDKNVSGDKYQIMKDSLSYDNKNKMHDWDLTYRRKIENILNNN